MKQVSDKFIAKMQDTLRSWVPRMTINGTEITEDIQTGLTINLGSCGPEDFGIGTAFIPSMTATITDCKTSLQDKEIKLEMGLVLDDSSIEYVPVGYFTVEKPNKGKFATSFTAYGRLMSKMGGAYESGLDYPATISSVISEVSSQTGLTVKTIGFSDVSGLIDTKPDGLNHRGAVQLIASLLGGFVTENSSGEIVICKYSINDALTLDTAFCYEYPFVHDSPYTVNGLSAVCGENEFISGEPNIYITNGYMSQTQFDICADNIVGFSYMPGSVKFLGDIRLDPWDSLKVTDDDAVYQIPCMDISHVWDGGLITVVQAPGTTEAEDGSDFKGSLSGRVDEIGSATDKISRVVADFIEAVEGKFGKDLEYVRLDEEGIAIVKDGVEMLKLTVDQIEFLSNLLIYMQENSAGIASANGLSFEAHGGPIKFSNPFGCQIIIDNGRIDLTSVLRDGSAAPIGITGYFEWDTPTVTASSKMTDIACKIRSYGMLEQVMIRLYGIVTAPAGEWTTVATVQAGYRPVHITPLYVARSNATSPVQARITSAGEIQVYPTSALSGHKIYIGGPWML